MSLGHEWDWPPERRSRRRYQMIDAFPRRTGWASPTVTRAVDIYWKIVITTLKMVRLLGYRHSRLRLDDRNYSQLAVIAKLWIRKAATPARPNGRPAPRDNRAPWVRAPDHLGMA
jgi:hypothetical protein